MISLLNYNFFTSNIIIFIFLGISFFIRKCFNNKISPKTALISDFFIILVLLFIFIPKFINFNFNFSSIMYSENKASHIFFQAMPLTKDKYLSTNKKFIGDIILLGGILLNIFWIVFCYFRLSLIKKIEIESPLFNSCCKRISVKAKLYYSRQIASPLSYGIIFKKVVIPNKNIENADIYIFYHELIHHKHRDLLTNFVYCFLKAFYWFNPLIYLWHKIIKLDMECYCDYSVIKLTNDHISYGNALITSAQEKLYNVGYMFSYKKQLKNRIIKITNFSKTYSPKKAKLLILFMLLSTILTFFSLNIYGYSLKTRVNAIYVDYEKYFGQYKGTLVMYDLNKEAYYIYNKALSEKRVSPNSVYKIAIALNALENNIITCNNSFSKWNGEDYPFNQWNQNQDLNSAMKYSVNWYFQELDKKISLKKTQAFLNKINYGNKALSLNKKNYWLEGELKISPIEQAEFLKGLINNDFSFKEESLQAVFNSMRLSEGYYGKTGSGMVNGKIKNGWFCSIIKYNEKNIILVVRVENADGAKAKAIAENFIKNEI